MGHKLDFEKLKARLAEVTGNKNDGQLLRFTKPGVVTVRLIDSGLAPDGDLFPFREFISLGKQQYCISENPEVRNTISAMQTQYFDMAGKKGSAEFDKVAFEVAKGLYPETVWYAPVIVRGEEDKGVQIWKIKRGRYAELVAARMKEEIGDYMDLKEGFDIEITVEKLQTAAAHFAAKIEVGRRPVPLSRDAAKVKEWVEAAQNIEIDDLHRKAMKSDEEILQALNSFVSGGASDVSESERRVTTNASDDLDKLVDDVAPSKAKKSSKRVDEDDDLDAAPTGKTKSDLDSQFDEIMADD